MSATIRVWTLSAAAREPATAPAAAAGALRPAKPSPREVARQQPLIRVPQKLSVSGEISDAVCSAAADRARQRR